MNNDSINKIDETIKNMTLEEKASLCSGKNYWYLKSIDRLSIPSVMVSDGPHGLRKQRGDTDNIGLNQSEPATCFPTAAGLASTWDVSLIEEVGNALGEECLQEGISTLLGPAVNIKRSPLCGRNFEYFSEDPFLAGELASAIIKGIQSKGIGTSLKHYAANNQENNRMTIDTLVDERALREIYLYAFEKAVKEAQPWTVMASYNKLNGSYACEDPFLLNDILRNEWGFEGIIISDWGAVNNRVAGIAAGLDLEMPGNKGMNDKVIVEAVQNGEISESLLDETVKRILQFIFKSDNNKQKGFIFNKEHHHELACKAAAESMVLLKNEGNVLPIKNKGKIALVGEFAKVPRYQGAGSSLVNPLKLENAYTRAKELFGDRLYYAQGYSLKNDMPDQRLIDEAVEVAGQCDTVIIMAGLPADYESEGFDRVHMCMPDSHNRLISAVCSKNKNTVVILYNGCPVEMPWIKEVSSVIEAYLPGEAGGRALWDVVLGNINPSGKLAESFPLYLNDNISSKYFPMGPSSVEYRESIYVGYRYFDSAKKQVLFPFGHGLSYTNFSYSELSLDKTNMRDSEKLSVTVKIKNAGNIKGSETVQLYIKDIESSIFKPEKELKGFKKISLEPGEEKIVDFVLDKRSFAYYDINLKDWHVENGDFLIMVGSSSRDIRCQDKVYVESSTDHQYSKESMAASLPYYYNIAEYQDIPENEFSLLLGRDIDNKSYSKKPYHRNSTVEEIKGNLIGIILYWVVMSQVKGMTVGNEYQLNMMKITARQLPLRSLVMMSNGIISFRHIDAIINLMNGKIVKCIGTLFSK